jgi:hypothetical protein
MLKNLINYVDNEMFFINRSNSIHLKKSFNIDCSFEILTEFTPMINYYCDIDEACTKPGTISPIIKTKLSTIVWIRNLFEVREYLFRKLFYQQPLNIEEYYYRPIFTKLKENMEIWTFFCDNDIEKVLSGKTFSAEINFPNSIHIDNFLLRYVFSFLINHEIGHFLSKTVTNSKVEDGFFEKNHIKNNIKETVEWVQKTRGRLGYDNVSEHWKIEELVADLWSYNICNLINLDVPTNLCDLFVYENSEINTIYCDSFGRPPKYYLTIFSMTIMMICILINHYYCEHISVKILDSHPTYTERFQSIQSLLNLMVSGYDMDSYDPDVCYLSSRLLTKANEAVSFVEYILKEM